MNWPFEPHREPLSFSGQCDANGWEHGFFWEPAEGATLFHFNSSIVRHRDRCLYAVRRADWITKQHAPARHWIDLSNDTVVADLDLDTMKLGPLQDIGYPRRHPREQFEDARLISTSMGLFLSMVVWLPRAPAIAQQAIVELGDDLKVRNHWQPVFGRNRADLGDPAQLMEKNWLWFESAPGVLALLYHHSPQTVVETVDRRFSSPVYISAPPQSEFGERRGGTPPVLWNGLWLTFCHCSFHGGYPAAWHPGVRRFIPRYYMCGLLFEPEPPFEISFFTRPILSGSLSSHARNPHGPAVFPGGAIITGDIATISLGVNDYASAWVKLNVAKLPWYKHQMP